MAQGPGNEEAHKRTREDVEGEGCREKMKGRKGRLALFEGGIAEDGFVGEDLIAKNVSIPGADGLSRMSQIPTRGWETFR